MPRNTLLTQLTGITESALYTYVCFYLRASADGTDVVSLTAYIDAMENEEVLDDIPLYEEGIGSLSPTYSFVMMVDMEKMVEQPETYVRLIPNFFFRRQSSSGISCFQYNSLVWRRWYIRIWCFYTKEIKYKI